MYDLKESEFQERLVVIGEGRANQYLWIVMEKLRDFDLVVVQAVDKYQDKMELICNMLGDACKFTIEHERHITTKSRSGYSLVVNRSWIEKHPAIRKY